MPPHGMPETSKSKHVAMSPADTLIQQTNHDTRSIGHMHTTLTQLLGDVLNVDVTKHTLHLDQHVNPQIINSLCDSPHRDKEHTGLCFSYHDLHIFCCACGRIAIYGPLQEYKNGTTDAQASMRSYRSV